MVRWVRGLVVGVVALAGVVVGVGVASAEQSAPSCERGEVCLWAREGYRGGQVRLSLATANPEECVPLPAGFDGRSFVNRLKRQVTVYQSRECATEGEFDTYPGGGTYVPVAPYVVRAIQIWSG